MRHLRFMIAAAMMPLALAACGSAEETTETAAQPEAAGPGLKLVLSEAADWKDVGAQIATVDQAQVLARIPGILSSLSVKEGDYVRQGQVIGRIVDSQLGYQAAAMQAQAVQAKSELERVEFLYENGVYSKARLDQAKAAAAAAKAQQSAVQAVAGQGAVVAPASGRVLMADIPAGSPVAPGMPIATITAGPVVLKIDLPESLATKIHVGSQVVATLPEGGEATGQITKVYPAVMGGQVRADATIPGLDATLIGRRIPARVEAGRSPALLVSTEYVTTAYGIDTVWVVGADGTAASVPVQTAPSSEAGMVKILSGVSAGDMLVKRAGK